MSEPRQRKNRRRKTRGEVMRERHVTIFREILLPNPSTPTTHKIAEIKARFNVSEGTAWSDYESARHMMSAYLAEHQDALYAEAMMQARADLEAARTVATESKDLVAVARARKDIAEAIGKRDTTQQMSAQEMLDLVINGLLSAAGRGQLSPEQLAKLQRLEELEGAP